MCLPVHASDTVHVSADPLPFDESLYFYYMDSSVAGVPDLISAFESRQYSLLPIVVPDPDFIHLQDGGVLPFDPDSFPARFVRRLIPVSDNGITVYPVTVMEVPDSGERQILNAAGDVIAEVKAPKGYDPLWYVRLRFPDLDTLDAESAARLIALYDPSRIMVKFQLITEDALVRKVQAESLVATQSLTFTPLALSYPSTGLAFDSMSVQTNGVVDVTMSWPSGSLASDGLDIFSCTNLMDQQWQILLSTNVNNASGSFAFSAPAAGDGETRFLDGWTHYDSDGDSLYDGRELRLYGTDRFDADTDGDQMPDGWEVQNGFDPLDPDDAFADEDSDGLTNLGEYQAGTDPQVQDSDGDGLSDGDEVYYGRVSHWGVNDTAQASIPANLTDAVSISAGFGHCLALRKDGTIAAWGDDEYGQVTGAASISNAVKVAAGYRYSLALLADGTVAGWGRNLEGQINVPTNMTNVVSISAGINHNLALLSDGTVAAWGPDVYGRVEDASEVSNAVAVAACYYHSLALLADGTVQGWGWDHYGQVSGASTISNAIAIASGFNFGLALLSDGTVTAWGENYNGQCSGATNVISAIAIDGGIYHGAAVQSDGSIVAWGENTYNECDVPVGLRASTVSASGYYTLALSGPLDPLDYDSDDDGLLDGQDLTVDASDSRYQAFAAAGIVYTNNGAQRTFKGEADAGTDPFNWQSSGCGIPDGWLVQHGFDPLDPSVKTQDSDSDGVTNYVEMIYGTDPWSVDSDGDTVSDYTEIMGGSDPLDSGETSNESGAATFLFSAGYQSPTGTGTGNGIATLQIGPLSVPFTFENPVQDLELQLPRAVLHQMSFSGATDHLGGALALAVDPQPNNMVIHDPAGLFGTPHSTSCGYPFAFVSFPVVYLSDVDISISWPDDYYLVADIVPDSLHGVFSYTVPDGYTATPATATNGQTYISADYPQCGYSYEELSVTFLAPSNCLTTIGTLSDTAELSNANTLEVDIVPVDDPGYYLGVDQTNTYRAVLNMNTPGTYQWSVDTNYLQIVGSDTESNVTITAIAPGQSYLYLDFTPEGAPSACGTSYEISAVGVDIVLTNEYPGTMITPIYDDTPGKKWVIATFPEPDQINVDWEVQLLGVAHTDVNIKYQRGTSSEAEVGWVGSTNDLFFTNGWLNASIRLNDGSNAVPQMSLSSNRLTISSVQQGDRIIIENPATGCRDEIAVVKNFSWNDLQRLGVGNLEMDAAFSNLDSSIKDAIVGSIVFCLDQSPNRDQRLQLSNDSFPDSGDSAIPPYTNFHAAHTNLLQLDIPSSRSVGSYPYDYDHWHLGVETETLPSIITNKKAILVDAAGTPWVSFPVFQSNTVAKLIDLINTTYADTNISFILSHTYEGSEGSDAVYVDPASVNTLKQGDPIRNVRWEFTTNNSARLSYPGQEENAEWEHGGDPPKEVWYVNMFVNRNGKVVICAGNLSANGQWSDALRE